jgi:nucleoside-diphosphate-sugar epimerase
MQILVLGGSVFVGRAMVDAAHALGAGVTVFNRGVSAPPPEGVTHVVGDRTDPADLEQLRGRRFDLVVDTCGFVPADVAGSAELLADSCAHYAFISSINVFPGWPEQVDYHAGGVWDGDPDATRDDVPPEFDGAQTYGWLKVGCERAVERAFGPERCAVIRAGGIVGPHDSAVGRLPWWLHRVARGGEVLVPGGPSDPIALIDARDLARFAVGGAPGTFEAGGPAGRATRGDLMAACRTATGSAASFTYVDSEWLRGQGVAYWTEVPLWVPPSEGPSVWAHDNAAAEAAGLSWRPLVETVADTWAWQSALGDAWRPGANTPGLAPDRERELLTAWHAS